MSMQPQPWPEVPVETARVVRKAFRKGSLPIRVRDELGSWCADGEFAAGYGVRGAPGISPAQLAMVTVLQFIENLTDRQAADAVRGRLDWKYCLGLPLADEGFDFTVLSEFRTRLVAADLESRIFDALLAALVERGLLTPGGRQRTDSTHVVSAVRDLNRLELAGESVRAAVEALAAAAPDWLAGAVDVADWAHRYGARIDSWRLPASKAKRADLAGVYGRDALRLLRAVHAEQAPAWLHELPAIDVLRQVLVQNYMIDADGSGREVIRTREADDGLPPGRTRISSPYDPDARWAAKGADLIWDGYKVHLTETCDPPAQDPAQDAAQQRPNLIVSVATTDASVPDSAMVEPIHTTLAQRSLLPGEHLLDSGYPSVPAVLEAARRWGITLVSPLRADQSRQARDETGYDRTAFTIDFDAQQARCPQGQTSTWWTQTHTPRGADKIKIGFTADTCRPCPVREQCTRSNLKRGIGRQLAVPPREVYQAQQAARAEQGTPDWKTRYAARAGVEGTIGQAVAVTGLRHTRYRGLPKTRLQHIFSAVALNLIRLDAYWNGHALDRTRTSHLTRLDLALAA